jgi:hypothetical protein
MPDLKFTDTMILSGGHSVMANHLPGTIPLQSFSENYFKSTKVDTEKYGLFGANTDYNTYYPNVTKEDLNPKDSEFIEPVFRLLSNCIVAKDYNPTEFPEEVLKASMNLLVGQTVNCDHETEIGNAIGSVKSVSWQDSYKADNGVVIPGGINGVLKIDAKANPRIARGILMDPPSIHSNSVTVMFEWEKSHNMSDAEFREKFNTKLDDGSLVRRIAKKIIAYRETSLVSHGADPFAQIIANGKINNPDYAGARYYSYADVQPMDLDTLKTKISYYDFKGLHQVDTMHNTSKFINEGNQNPQKNNNMNEVEKFLEQLFGQDMLSLAEGSTPTVELAFSQIKDIISENQSLSEAKTKAEGEVTSLKEEVDSLKETIKLNEKMVSLGEAHLKDVREATIASYKKTVDEDKVDANILSLLEADTTNVETLLSLKATYDAQVEEKFPLHCADCGSKNVNRASSMANTDTEGSQAGKDTGYNIVSVMKNIAKTK